MSETVVKKDAALTVLGIDVTKTITSGLTGGISSVVSSGATMLLGRALATQGIYIGDEKWQHQLDEINDELKHISDTITAVQASVDQLQSELKVDTIALQNSINQSSLVGPFSVIENSMATLCSLTKNENGSCGNFSIFSPDKKRELRSTETVTKERLRKFAEDIISPTTGVGEAITQIKNVLINPPNDIGAINTFANYAITKMDQGDTRVKDWYLWLENAVMQYMVELNNGMILMVNAHSYLYDDPEKTATDALDYIKDTYLPSVVNPIMDQFQSAVERMVLSRYNPIVESGNVSFVGTEDLNEIFTRAQLFTWLSSNITEQEPGVLFTSYLRSSLVSGSDGPALTPNHDYSASKGLVPAVSKFFNGSVGSKMDNWYKCVDFDDAAATQLRSFEDSDIRLARYRWQFPTEPTVGQALNSSGLFASVKPQFYDRRTLELLTDCNEYATTAAIGVDASSILVNLFFNNESNLSETGSKSPVPAWEKEGFVDPGKDQDAKNMMKDIEESWSASSNGHYVKLQMNIKKDDGFMSGAGPCRYKAKLKRNVYFSGSSDRDIYLYSDTKYDGEIDQVKEYTSAMGTPIVKCYYPPTSMDLVYKINYFDKPSNNSDSKDKGGTKLKDKSGLRIWSSNGSNYTKGEYVKFKGKNYAELQFRVYITGERQATMGTDYCKKKSFVKGHWHVNNLRLAWPQPTLNQ